MQRAGISLVSICLSFICLLLVGLVLRQITDLRTASIDIFCVIILGILVVSLQRKRQPRPLPLRPVPEVVTPGAAPLSGAKPAQVYIGTLVTASATTGWLDWIHGELWIFPQGLLRIPSGLGRTMMNGLGPTVNRQRTKIQRFDSVQFQHLLAKKSNRWTPREQIVKAYLHQGFSTDRLRLVLIDGRSEKVLWLPIDNAFPALQQVLIAWLGNNLVID
jgi:hypothetical protein